MNSGTLLARANRTAIAGSTQNNDRYSPIPSHPRVVMG